jgi:Skp family chaperone for outer membrane proteins
MKTTMLLAVATLVPGLFLMQASGGSSVAVIDFARAVSEAPGGKDAIAKLDTFQKEQLTAMEGKQKEADVIENRLRVQAPVLTEATRTQLTRDLETARTAIQTMGQDAQQKLAQMEQELLRPVEQKTTMAVTAYAAEHSLKIVLDASVLQGGIVYAHDTADITSEIIRRIAGDLQTPSQLNASSESQRFLNRKWVDFSIRRNEQTAQEPGN